MIEIAVILCLLLVLSLRTQHHVATVARLTNSSFIPDSFTLVTSLNFLFKMLLGSSVWRALNVLL